MSKAIRLFLTLFIIVLSPYATFAQGWQQGVGDNIQFSAGFQSHISPWQIKASPKYTWKINEFSAIGPDEIKPGTARSASVLYHAEANLGIKYRRNVLFRVGLKFFEWGMDADPYLLRYYDNIDPERGYVKGTAYRPNRLTYQRNSLMIPLGVELRSNPVRRWNLSMQTCVLPEIRIREQLTGTFYNKPGYLYQTRQFEQAPRSLRLWLSQRLMMGWRYDSYGIVFIKGTVSGTALASDKLRHPYPISVDPHPRYQMIFIPEISVGIQIILPGSL